MNGRIDLALCSIVFGILIALSHSGLAILRDALPETEVK